MSLVCKNAGPNFNGTSLGFKVAIALTFIVVNGGMVWIVSQMERLFDRLNGLE